jgi:predicted phosphoribosyltransferase
VLVARKLGAPFESELAIGAVTASGGRFLNPDIVSELGISEAYLEEVTTQQMRRREERLRGVRPAAGDRRVVLSVDDGLAVPVGSPHACEALRRESYEVICLYEPVFFFAMGAFYEHFEPTQAGEIQRLRRETRTPATSAGGAPSVRF